MNIHWYIYFNPTNSTFFFLGAACRITPVAVVIQRQLLMLINSHLLLLSPPGDQEISPIHPQMNATEPDNPRTWSATSVVQVSAMRERHGDILRCAAYHESYTAKSVVVEARLDVKCECCDNDMQNCDTAPAV